MESINCNYPVAQPDANGLYEWMCIRAGGQSQFAHIEMFGDLDMNGFTILNAAGGGGGGGEANTAANIGTAVGAVGVFKNKTGVTLNLRSIAPVAGNRILVKDEFDCVNIDVVEANLNLSNIGGVVPVFKGGTGLSAYPSDTYVKFSGTGAFMVRNNFAGLAAPNNSNDSTGGYRVGSIWVNTLAIPPKSYICTRDTVGNAYWEEVAGAAGGGEVNSGVSIGSAANKIDVYKQKTGLNLEFRAVGPSASNRISASLGQETIQLDVVEANLSLSNIGGIVPVSKGGTGLGSHLYPDTYLSFNGAAVQSIRNNFNATLDPLVGNDVNSGYREGSIWINKAVPPNKVFICTNDSAGAAVWSQLDSAGAGLPTPLPVANGGTGFTSYANTSTVVYNGIVSDRYRNNYQSAVSPGLTDDNSAGYRKGSIWINTTKDRTFMCTDDTNGNALWKEMTNDTPACVGYVVGSLDADNVTRFANLDDAVNANKTYIIICANTLGTILLNKNYTIIGTDAAQISGSIVNNHPNVVTLHQCRFAVTLNTNPIIASNNASIMTMRDCKFLGAYNYTVVNHGLRFYNCFFESTFDSAGVGGVMNNLFMKECFVTGLCEIKVGSENVKIDIQSNVFALGLDINGVTTGNSIISKNFFGPFVTMTFTNIIGCYFSENLTSDTSANDSVFTCTIAEKFYICNNRFGGDEVHLYFTNMNDCVVTGNTSNNDGTVTDFNVGITGGVTTNLVCSNNAVTLKDFKGTFQQCIFTGNRIKANVTPWQFHNAVNACVFTGNCLFGTTLRFLNTGTINNSLLSGNMSDNLQKQGGGTSNLVVANKGIVAGWGGEYGPVNIT